MYNSTTSITTVFGMVGGKKKIVISILYPSTGMRLLFGARIATMKPIPLSLYKMLPTRLHISICTCCRTGRTWSHWSTAFV